jgi:acyl carrier protein
LALALDCSSFQVRRGVGKLLDTKTVDIVDREFASRVLRIIVAQDEEIDPAKVLPETTFKSLGFDSFAMVSLMFALENEFHLEITDEMLSGIKTVGDVIERLHELCATGVTTP